VGHRDRRCGAFSGPEHLCKSDGNNADHGRDNRDDDGHHRCQDFHQGQDGWRVSAALSYKALVTFPRPGWVVRSRHAVGLQVAPSSTLR
jgi:hypothetical protein